VLLGYSSSYLIVHEVQTTNYKVASELIMSVNCANDKVKGAEKSKCPSLKNKTSNKDKAVFKS